MRVSVHLDNQFRLLREDMICEMREELQIVMGKKKGYHRGIKLLKRWSADSQANASSGLVVEFLKDLPQLRKLKGTKRRKEYLEHPNFLKYRSLACLVSGTDRCFPYY
ncbi:hypothetical protein BDZ97DRAFT_106456 [Flammula alnicola]|nr:hypothetical protein BDZ97DRAFT_106456 [Flammula alnicola]